MLQLISIFFQNIVSFEVFYSVTKLLTSNQFILKVVRTVSFGGKKDYND